MLSSSQFMRAAVVLAGAAKATLLRGVLGALVGIAACSRDDAAPQRARKPSDADGAAASVAEAPVASNTASATASLSPGPEAPPTTPSPPRTFSLVARLTAPKGAFHDSFGVAFAEESDILAVGAPGRDEPSLNAGAVYVFERDASGYRLSQTLRRPRPTAYFGGRLAMMDGRLLVSRAFPGPDELPTWFARRGGEFAAEGALARPEASRFNLENFGHALAVHGSRLLVAARGGYGVPGRAFLYRNNGGVLEQEHRFDPESSTNFEVYNFYMGEQVALDDRHAILTALLDPAANSSIVIFRREESGWRYEQTLVKTIGDISLSGSLLLVGSSFLSRPVTVYRDDGARFVPVGKLEASSGVAVDADVAALSTGALFRWDGARFVDVQRLTREGGRRFSGEGPVMLHGGLLVIGEPEEEGKGAVYVYEAGK